MKNNSIKRIITAIMVVAMILSLGAFTYAEDDGYKMTIVIDDSAEYESVSCRVDFYDQNESVTSVTTKVTVGSSTEVSIPSDAARYEIYKIVEVATTGYKFSGLFSTGWANRKAAATAVEEETMLASGSFAQYNYVMYWYDCYITSTNIIYNSKATSQPANWSSYMLYGYWASENTFAEGVYVSNSEGVAYYVYPASSDVSFKVTFATGIGGKYTATITSSTGLTFKSSSLNAKTKEQAYASALEKVVEQYGDYFFVDNSFATVSVSGSFVGNLIIPTADVVCHKCAKGRVPELAGYQVTDTDVTLY